MSKNALADTAAARVGTCTSSTTQTRPYKHHARNAPDNVAGGGGYAIGIGDQQKMLPKTWFYQTGVCYWHMFGDVRTNGSNNWEGKTRTNLTGMREWRGG